MITGQSNGLNKLITLIKRILKTWQRFVDTFKNEWVFYTYYEIPNKAP